MMADAPMDPSLCFFILLHAHTNAHTHTVGVSAGQSVIKSGFDSAELLCEGRYKVCFTGQPQRR